MTTKSIQPVERVSGSIRIPGSKSITHRALILAALAETESEILNALSAEDTLITAEALRRLGADVAWEEERVRVTPPARRWVSPGGAIPLSNSGTSARLLLAVAAAGEGRFAFDGSPRLRERPMDPVIQAITSLGPRLTPLARPGYLPVEILSNGIRGGDVTVDARESSQFLSALLLVAPLASSEMRIGWLEPAASFPYVEITLAMMRAAGLRFTREDGPRIIVPAPQRLAGMQTTVEGDFSSASYFWAAAAVTGGEIFTGPLFPESPQGDRGLLAVLERMGCRVEWVRDGVRVHGPDRLEAIDVDMNRMPDMVPTLAVVAAFASGTTRIRNVSHLRIKESDRLGVMARELAKFGVPVQETPDGLIIEGGHARTPTEPVFAHDDHRIAMTFAVAGLGVPGVRIEGAEAVVKSYPSFWEHFERLHS